MKNKELIRELLKLPLEMEVRISSTIYTVNNTYAISDGVGVYVLKDGERVIIINGIMV